MTGALALLAAIAALTLLPAALVAVAVVYGTSNPREGDKVGRKSKWLMKL